jgi:hypothetical protein
MTTFKTISRAVACALTVLAASVAYAQGPTARTGSTDIYNADFQKTFATGSRVGYQEARAITGTGSTDIYNTDFQKTFATGSSVGYQEARAITGTGSTDIYTTDFQKTFATDNSVHQTPDVAGYKGSTDIWTTDFQKAFM